MGMKDLAGKVSLEDVEDAKKSIDNDFLFDESSGTDDFDALFSSLESQGSGDTMMQDPSGLNNGISGLRDANGTGMPAYMQNNQDKAAEWFGKAASEAGGAVKDMIVDIKTCSYEESGHSGDVIMKWGIGFFALGVVGFIAWLIGGSEAFWKEAMVWGATGATTAGLGIILLGVSANKAEAGEDGVDRSIEDFGELGDTEDADAFEEFMDAMFAEAEKEDNDKGIDDFLTAGATAAAAGATGLVSDKDPFEETMRTIVDDREMKIALDSIRANQVLGREVLVSTMENILPLCTPKFSAVIERAEDSNEFAIIKACMKKVIANVANMDESEVNAEISDVKETLLSFQLKMRRIKKISNITKLEEEINIYFKPEVEDGEDEIGISSKVTTNGDFYNIIITKGANAVVSIGDAMRKDKVKEFLLNKNNKLPIFTGITDTGAVIMDDAKTLDAMMIAGKPRSGKSWYILSMFMSMMMFNVPEDVQFIVIDPKNSYLLNTMSLMPHVCGYHSDPTVTMDIIRRLIDEEAVRRKELFLQNKCDDIWALWDKGVKIPVLYLVIDEFMTVKKALTADDAKELDKVMSMLITQLPSLGIRIVFVPHRAQGVVDKTIRMNMGFKCAIRADMEVVNETLDPPEKWTRPLQQPGETAVITNARSARFVRGLAVAGSDKDNIAVIKTIARAFYKMKAEIPDMTSLGFIANRDEDRVMEELGIKSAISKGENEMSADHVFDDI